MKTNYFLGAAAAFGLFALASCSNEDDPITQQPGEEIATGEQVIVLDMQDTDVLSTKSRPLYSTTNQGAELVTDVKLFVFEHADSEQYPGTAMKLVNVLTINNWDQNSSDYNYGRKYSLKLEGEDKLETGKTYTILAVGQDESNTSATTFAPYKIFAGDEETSSFISTADWSADPDASWSAGSNNGDGFLLTDAADRTNKNEAEIFSGISNPVDLNFDGGFTAEVLLKRQVAGVLGYFSKIPAIVSNNESNTNWYENYDAVKAIRLVAHNKNTRIDLAHALYDQGDDATNEGDEYVVNGFTQATADTKYMATTTASDDDAYTVYQIDLNKWFTAKNSNANNASYWFGTDITGSVYFEDGIPSLGEDAKYATTDQSSSGSPSYPSTLTSPTWVNALSQSNSNPTVMTNSVLAGEFVIPFEKNTSTSNYTFELQLLGGEGNKILKRWNVKLDKQSIDTEKGDSEYAFNVYRNHLYQIGKRGSGDSPTDPGTDPDKPQALDKDQDLTIFINDQWEFIHDLEIE